MSPDTFDFKKSRGEQVDPGRWRSAHPAYGSSPTGASVTRYHGYRTHVPVITVAHVVTAISDVPQYSRRMRSRIPAVVINPGRRAHNPASPPANANSNTVPSTSPWITVQNSRDQRSIALASLPSRQLHGFSDVDASRSTAGLPAVSSDP